MRGSPYGENCVRDVRNYKQVDWGQLGQGKVKYTAAEGNAGPCRMKCIAVINTTCHRKVSVSSISAETVYL